MKNEFIIGDLCNGDNKTWNYRKLQINIADYDKSGLPQVHENFEISLKFTNGSITDKKNKTYTNGLFKTNIVKDQKGRFGNNVTHAICAIWQNGKKDGILTGWFKDQKLQAGDKVILYKLKDGSYRLEPGNKQ